MSDHDPVTDPSPDAGDDDLKALLARRQRARPTKATWILLALLAIALGFALGSCTQRAFSSLTPPGADAPPASGAPVSDASTSGGTP